MKVGPSAAAQLRGRRGQEGGGRGGAWGERGPQPACGAWVGRGRWRLCTPGSPRRLGRFSAPCWWETRAPEEPGVGDCQGPAAQHPLPAPRVRPACGVRSGACGPWARWPRAVPS